MARIVRPTPSFSPRRFETKRSSESNPQVAVEGKRCDAMLFRERRPSSLVAETGNSKPVGVSCQYINARLSHSPPTTHDLHGCAVAFWFRANVARLLRAASLMGLVRLGSSAYAVQDIRILARCGLDRYQFTRRSRPLETIYSIKPDLLVLTWNCGDDHF